MRKYLFRYLVFWAPAILAAYLLAGRGTTAEIIQWFCGFLMLLVWAVNTGQAAYEYPRQTLTFILAYFGVNALLITALFRAPFGSLRYVILDHTAGAFTFRPLYMLYQTLREFSLSQEELWITGIVTAVCVVGFICGMLYRQVKPNPCRPTFIGR